MSREDDLNRYGFWRSPESIIEEAERIRVDAEQELIRMGIATDHATIKGILRVFSYEIAKVYELVDSIPRST